jgi:hypothetical protein
MHWDNYRDEYDYDDYVENTCHHGNPLAECDKCDEETEQRGGIDKCLNCGRYKFGDQLNQDQCCIKRCRNPNEY